MTWLRNFIQLSANFSRQPSVKPTFTPPSLTRLLQFSTVSQSPATVGNSANKYAGLGPTKGDEKPRVVVLGSGWAGCRLIKDIDTKIYDVVCVSPRNHMVFTPLLASTCVGTLEFRSVAEPIGRIQPAISREPGSYFFLSNCTRADFQNQEVLKSLSLSFHLFYGAIREYAHGYRTSVYLFLDAWHKVKLPSSTG